MNFRDVCFVTVDDQGGLPFHSTHSGLGNAMTIFTLYLIGYGNQVPEEFFTRLEERSPNGSTWLVVDVRARRRSWAWSYSAGHIDNLFQQRGHVYIWMIELGNEGNRHEVRLVNEQVGLWALEMQLRRSRRPVILLCAERLSSRCHRSAIAGMMARRLEAKGDRLEVRRL